MQNKTFSFTAILLVASISSPAFAQFTASLGVQSAELDVNTHTELNNVTADGVDALDGNATTTDIDIGGELALGYQFNFAHGRNIAFEAFGQLLASDTKVTPITGASFAALENEATASFDWIAGLRVRPGYDVTPTIRVFLDGGIAWGGFEVEYEDGFITANEFTPFGDDSDTLFGWRYGAGMEYKFTKQFLIGVDYIITEFNELDADELADAKGGLHITSPVYTTYTPTLHTLGLNFKYLFGHKEHREHYHMSDK